jgi:hypothetical protein
MNAIMSNDNNITCRIKRSDRPCLVCSGHMDLIEAHPSRFNLFSGALPYMCGAEGVDCLDCPNCGFKTTTADYQYLHMCKKERQTGTGSIILESSQSYTKKTTRGGGGGGGDRTSSSTTRGSRRQQQQQQQQQQQIGNGRRSGSISSSNSNSNSNSIRGGANTSTTCSHCQASLESSSWQFCPSCGKKCTSSSPTSSGTTTTTMKKKNEQQNKQNNKHQSNEIIKDIETNHTMPSINSCSSRSSNSNSRDSGIVRMVTPPKRTSIDDYSSPVQMQY